LPTGTCCIGLASVPSSLDWPHQTFVVCTLLNSDVSATPGQFKPLSRDGASAPHNHNTGHCQGTSPFTYPRANMPPTTDLATLLTQLYQHAQIMDNILKATYIPTNITDAGQAHCRKYLGRASDHMIKMGDAFRSISVQHPQDLDTHEVRAASARQYHLLVRFMELTTTLEERTQARPKHSNTQQGLLNTQAGTNDIVTVPNQIVNTRPSHQMIRCNFIFKTCG
jgi:hypothetical protein